MRSTFKLTLAIGLLCACGDLEAEGEPSTLDSGLDTQVPTDSGVPVELAKEVDTSSNQVWIYLDLETGETRTTEWPDWDLKLQRFKLATNGGASGSGMVKVAVVLGTPYASLTTAPQQGYASDPPDGSDSDLEPDYVLSTGDHGWYDYDEMTHALAPRPLVYAIRSQEGGFFKFVIEGYYNVAGSSGYLKLRWLALSAPDGPIIERDASEKPDAGIDAMTSASTP